MYEETTNENTHVALFWFILSILRKFTFNFYILIFYLINVYLLLHYVTLGAARTRRVPLWIELAFEHEQMHSRYPIRKCSLSVCSEILSESKPEVSCFLLHIQLVFVWLSRESAAVVLFGCDVNMCTITVLR